MLRLADLDEQQMRDREKIVDVLEKAGWEPTVNHKIVENGLPFEYQASFEYDNDSMSLLAEYAADDGRLELSLESPGGEAVLAVEPGDKLDRVLDLIVSFQDEVSPDNFRTYVRKILDIGVPVYADRGDEGFRPLVKDDDE